MLHKNDIKLEHPKVTAISFERKLNYYGFLYTKNKFTLIVIISNIEIRMLRVTLSTLWKNQYRLNKTYKFFSDRIFVKHKRFN